jgi:choline dehydrogenase-like flavoprotein
MGHYQRKLVLGPIRLLSIDQPHPITEAYMAAGNDCGFPSIDEHNGASMTGPTLNTLTIVNGRRQSVADAYLTPALTRNNLTLRSGCIVTGLLFQGSSKCCGLEILVDGRRETLRSERGVILAAGAIGSPAILLRSGIGPAGDLRALDIEVRQDLPAVGENLHDHLLSGGNLYRSKQPVPPSLYQHSESLMYLPDTSGSPAPGLVLACVVVPVATECFTAPELGSAYTLMFGFTHPKSRGRIRLASADSLAAPLIDPCYLETAEDRSAYLEALEMAQQIGHTKALYNWRENEILPGPAVKTKADRLNFLQQAAYTHHHPVGTCRMGNGEDAVVTPGLQVKGVENLYVVDASVIPEITTGPVNAAVVAIAERASDLLLGRRPLPAASIPP